MAGVLRLYKETVKNVMIDIDNVHMLADNTQLSLENLDAILQSGELMIFRLIGVS